MNRDLNGRVNDIISRNDSVHIRSQDIDSNNIYSGIGAPWNLTHYANRTDSNLAASFTNNSYGIVNIPLYQNWEGYNLGVKVNNLYDTRNWCNGTFHYGTMNSYDPIHNFTEDDSSYIKNKFQNWTFNSYDVQTEWDPVRGAWRNYLNNMSGNYFDSSVAGQDCLELRMHGYRHYSGNWYYGYNSKDKCWWNTSIPVPRGKVVDAKLNFQLYTNHMMTSNYFVIRFYINNIDVYHITNLDFTSLGLGTWHSFSISQAYWTNISSVFTTLANNSKIGLNASLEFYGGSVATNVGNADYQQVLVDNVELSLKTEVKPSQIQLKMNSTTVQDVTWGEGIINISGKWNGTNYQKVNANFSSNDVGKLGRYNVSLKADLNLFAKQHAPETNYETNINSVGTKFSVINNSYVEWECYGFIEVPTKYQETNLTLVFPTDLNITHVYSAPQPTINIINSCINSTAGKLIIRVNSISNTPNGFWKIKGRSPNYCSQLNFYNNNSGSWLSTTAFYSGDYFNVTAKIQDSPLISGYVQSTKAFLYLRFPNNSIWIEHLQMKAPDTNGIVCFNSSQIPSTSPNYEAGEYKAIITWNNSHNLYGFNETGIIYSTFKVIHNSTLIADQNQYFFDNILENSIINLKVSFKDKINNNPITSAEIYTYKLPFPSGLKQTFSEISAGLYFLEYNVSGAVNLENNTITIYGSSPYFEFNKVNITIYIVRETILSVNATILSVQWNQNFSIQFNYTEKNSKLGINTIVTHDWSGAVVISTLDVGQYIITCNTSNHDVNDLYSLNIQLLKDGFQSQSKEITIEIKERETYLEIKFNNTFTSEFNFYNLSIGEQLNATLWYRDAIKQDNPFIFDANVQVTGAGPIKTFVKHPTYNQYQILLNATELGQGVNFLTLTAKQDNYTLVSESVKVSVKERPTKLSLFINETTKLDSQKYEAKLNNFLNITVFFIDNETKTHIENATVYIEGGVSLKEDIYNSRYNVSLDTNTLGQGVNYFKIIAEKDNYQTQLIVFFIEVIESNSSLQLFLNSFNKTIEESIEITIGQFLNITVYYNDDGGIFIDNATVELSGIGQQTYDLTRNNIFHHYNITIDTLDLGRGINTLTLYVGKTNYQQHTIKIKVTIIDKSTLIQVFLNNENKTIDKFYELTIGSTLNITISYLESDTLQSLDNALVEIKEGALTLGNLTEFALKYIFILNASNLNSIGLKSLIIIAQKTNYQTQTLVIQVNIKPIIGQVKTVDDKDKIDINLGENTKIQIILEDKELGTRIKNASVTYSWDLGDGELTDEDGDGIYETTIKNAPTGTYIITISVNIGENYDFERFELTLNVKKPKENVLIYQVLTGVGIAVAIALTAYLIAYQKVLKYPKPVRKVRKVKKNLKKEKSLEKMDILNRELAVNEMFEIKLGDLGGVIKKMKAKATTKDKFPEDKLLNSQKKPDLGGETQK